MSDPLEIQVRLRPEFKAARLIHPTPWKQSGLGYLIDANGQLVDEEPFSSEEGRAIVEAVNKSE